jgi:hypothetical protein
MDDELFGLDRAPVAEFLEFFPDPLSGFAAGFAAGYAAGIVIYNFIRKGKGLFNIRLIYRTQVFFRAHLLISLPVF